MVKRNDLKWEFVVPIVTRATYKKMNWFCESQIPFKWNYWNGIAHNFNWLLLNLDSWIPSNIYIPLKRNGMQISAKDIENLFVIFFLKIHGFKKTPSHSYLLKNWLNKFQFGMIIQKNNLWNLKFVLSKLASMNHHH